MAEQLSKYSINNYAFVDANNSRNWIVPELYTNDYCIVGTGIRKGLPDHSYLITTPVQYVRNGLAKTLSGTRYILHSMSPDYRQFVNAVRENIPILRQWEISGNRKVGYTISGICNGRFVQGLVVSQDKNFITLENGKQYFVLWVSYIRVKLHSDGMDIPFDFKFEDFGSTKCRPILFG